MVSGWYAVWEACLSWTDLRSVLSALVVQGTSSPQTLLAPCQHPLVHTQHEEPSYPQHLCAPWCWLATFCEPRPTQLDWLSHVVAKE